MLFAPWQGLLMAAEDLESLADSVRGSINKGIVFFHSISQQGGYENDLSSGLKQAKARFAAVRTKRAGQSLGDREAVLKAMSPKIRTIIQAQDDQGRWITHNDRFKKYVSGVRWNGEYTKQDRISSAVFNANMRTLCDFLALIKKEQ